METNYKWCDGCYENQGNQLSHSCLKDYIIINNNSIEVKISDLNLSGNYYNSINDNFLLNGNITIRLYQGTKIYGKIIINYNNNNNNNYNYNYNFKYNGDKVIMERIIDYFLEHIIYKY
jgi:hypothetical protein